jgi:hypothetical protein
LIVRSGNEGRVGIREGIKDHIRIVAEWKVFEGFLKKCGLRNV